MWVKLKLPFKLYHKGYNNNTHISGVFSRFLLNVFSDVCVQWCLGLTQCEDVWGDVRTFHLSNSCSLDVAFWLNLSIRLFKQNSRWAMRRVLIELKYLISKSKAKPVITSSSNVIAKAQLLQWCVIWQHIYISQRLHMSQRCSSTS